MLSGDHVYKMDYAKMLRFHKERGAAVTLAAIEIPIEEAYRFGVLSVDEQDRVTGFIEKSEERADDTRARPISRSGRWASTSSTPTCC